MKIQTLSEVLDLLGDGRAVDKANVAARVLKCKIWVYGAGSPGCMYDSGPYYDATKGNAIACLAEYATDQNGDQLRGVKTALRRDHCFYANGWRYEISQTTLGDVL